MLEKGKGIIGVNKNYSNKKRYFIDYVGNILCWSMECQRKTKNQLPQFQQKINSGKKKLELPKSAAFRSLKASNKKL